MNSRQLAQRLGVQQSTITRLEKREAAGNVTLNVLGRVARAMNAKLVYAIVPDAPYQNVDAIVLERARDLARELVHRTEHSMRLEKQGTKEAALARQITDLTAELKSKGDSRIWGQSSPPRPNRRK